MSKGVKTIKLDWFNGQKASKISWKIAYIPGLKYEHGLPHTRNDVIIITKPTHLFTTLVHEKVHLYQKKYPDDVELYLLQKGFERLRKREKKDCIRANPDIDQWIYKRGKRIYKCVYKSKFPDSIEEVTSFMFEHPFETMAEDIEKLIVTTFC